MAERPTGTPCWVDVSVPDVEAAKTFYAGLLGWDCRTDPRPEAGGYTMCFVDGVVAAAITPMWSEHAKPGWSIYFASDDADLEPRPSRRTAARCWRRRWTSSTRDAWRSRSTRSGRPSASGRRASTAAWRRTTRRAPWPGSSWLPAAPSGPPGSTSRVRPEGRAVPGHADYWLLQQGGETTGGLIELDEATSGADGSHWRVYVTVADADASCERAIDARRPGRDRDVRRPRHRPDRVHPRSVQRAARHHPAGAAGRLSRHRVEAQHLEPGQGEHRRDPPGRLAAVGLRRRGQVVPRHQQRVEALRVVALRAVLPAGRGALGPPPVVLATGQVLHLVRCQHDVRHAPAAERHQVAADRGEARPSRASAWRRFDSCTSGGSWSHGMS